MLGYTVQDLHVWLASVINIPRGARRVHRYSTITVSFRLGVDNDRREAGSLQADSGKRISMKPSPGKNPRCLFALSPCNVEKAKAAAEEDGGEKCWSGISVANGAKGTT